MTRIKLTGEDIDLNDDDEYYYREADTHLIIDCKGQDAEQLKKQILEDYEKSIKWDNSLCDETIKELKDKADKWDNIVKTETGGTRVITGLSNQIIELEAKVKDYEEALLNYKMNVQELEAQVKELKEHSEWQSNFIKSFGDKISEQGKELQKYKQFASSVIKWHQSYNYETKDGFREGEFKELKQLIEGLK
jgi:chromosome segregation ATPase